MIYTITHSSIAASIRIHDETGREFSCYYIGQGAPVQEGVTGTEGEAENRFRRLPGAVRAIVERQFNEVFSVPAGERAAWILKQSPVLVYLEELDEAERARRGRILGDVLGLKMKRENGRYDTTWGDKTPLGLFETVKRIIEQGE